MYFDWFGTAEELKELDEAIKAYSDEHDGIKYKGRYGPHGRKFHWVRIFETDTYPLPPAPRPRDYNKQTHVVLEIFSGPQDLD